MASTDAIGAGAAAGRLLERERELADIDRLLERIGSGAGELLVVESPAGSGKTRLLDAMKRTADAREMTVLATTGSELERELAFGVVRSLFGPFLGRLTQAKRRSLLSGAAGWATPVVAPSGEDLAAPEPTSVLNGLFWLVSNVAERGPLVIAIDDAHWCDLPSLRFAAYLARRLEDLGVLLAVAARPHEPGGAGDMVATLIDAGRAQVMRPDPLSKRAIATLVRERLVEEPDDEFCAACHAASGGNPFLVGELLVALSDDRIEPIAPNAKRVGEIGPSSVARMVLTRLTRIGREAAALAEAVSVLGAQCELRHATALAGLNMDEAAQAADALFDIDVLGSTRPLEFVHPLVRSAIYQSIGSAERSLKHAAAARMLADEEASVGRVALHLMHAEPAGEEWVVAALRAAAAEASARGAPDQAAGYLRRALAEPPSALARPEVLHELGAAELLARDPAATDHLAQALDATDDGLVRGGIALLLGRAAVSAGRLSDARELLGPMIAELAEAQPEIAARLEAYRSAVGVWDPRFAAELELELPRLRALAENRGTDGRSLLLMIAFRSAFDGGPRNEIVGLVERGLDQGRLLVSESAEAIEITWAVRALTFIDELDRAEALLEEMVADARRRGSVMGYATTSAWRADVALRRGLVAACEADARSAVELANAHGLHFIAPHAHSLFGEALIEKGELELAAALLEHADLGPMHGSRPEVRFLHTRARARLARGDSQRAIADLRTCEAQGSWFRNPNVLSWRSTLALALSSSSREEALAMIDVDLKRSLRIGQPRAIGIALRVQGLLSDRGAQVELLRQAVATLEGCPSRLELARALTDLGAALRRSGQRRDSREPLRQGLNLAAECGALLLARRARDELVAAGARPRRERLGGPEALTASERRVAEMAATGMTNREIAQALFVTMKTTAMHLTHAYQKLDISGRDELPVALSTASPRASVSTRPAP